MSDRILLIDDDTVLAGITAEYLEARGYNVDVQHNAVAGLKQFKAAAYTLCLLDVRMPFKDGFELAVEIREADPDIPFIFLTGNTERDDRIKGLLLGADDYITKPFSMEELYLRIKNVLKRQDQASEQTVFQIGMYSFDSVARRLFHNNEGASLSEAESQLLSLFCTQKDGLVTREMALKRVWQDEDQLKSRSLNVYINKLRKRLAADPKVELLNVYGTGYQLVISSQ